jgi:cation diffusion facilitator CzcD-associated flavoprotein CzcO
MVHLQLLDLGLLSENTLWRDLFAFTGTMRTFNGVDRILSVWKELCDLHRPCEFRLVPKSVRVVKPAPALSWIEAKFSFRTQGRPAATCTGTMRLIRDEQWSWKLWTLVTMLQDLQGFPSLDDLKPSKDWDVSQVFTPVSEPDDSLVHDCVIVGSGMSGLCLAGYVKALGIKAVILERKAKIGQNWTDRYDSISIHTSRSHGQLPYQPVWGSEYPYHLSISDLEEGYQKYVQMYDLDVWLSTLLEKASWNSKERNWTLQISRIGRKSIIQTKHLVLAIGAGGQVPKTPELSNRNLFKGEVLHTVEYKNSKAWTGLTGVVVGSANSAHDITDDMLQSGLKSVTMVQRGRTPVLPVEYYRRIYDSMYNDKIPVAISDEMTMTQPTAIARLMAMKALGKFASEEPERFDALERQGFRVERHIDMYHCLYERFGSHYLDVGVSKKVADGQIKVKSNAALVGFTEAGLLFSDGSSLEADVVVFATGFECNMRLAAIEIVGEAVGDTLDDWWGVDSEGELRGAWKPIGHPGIWFTGGNVALARFFSRFLAFQIAADLKGMPLTVYSK